MRVSRDMSEQQFVPVAYCHAKLGLWGNYLFCYKHFLDKFFNLWIYADRVDFFPDFCAK